jgi:heme a synthase
MNSNNDDNICRTHRPVAISNWLYTVAFLVFIMVIVGGVTRLTESGLSITEWKPITGAIPPMSEAVWLAEFEKYKQIPEYLEINGPAGMTWKISSSSISGNGCIAFWDG